MENKCEACGGDRCGDCESCHSCVGGVCTDKKAGVCGVHGCTMRHRHIRSAFMIALVALASWGFVEAVSGIQEFRFIGTGINPTNTISVEGSGKIFTVADTATFSFTISETKDNVGAAQKVVAEKMDSITTYLKDTAGVEDRDIKTTDYSAYPKYENVPCPISGPCPRTQEIVGYIVSETVTIKVRDTEKAGEVLANIGNRGVSHVSGLSFTVDDEEFMKEKARSKAIVNARAKAGRLAKDLGVSLVRVVGYYDSTPGPYYFGKAMGMGGDSIAELPEAVNIQVGENVITSNVTITYEIR